MNIFKQIQKKSQFSNKKVLLDQKHLYSDLYLLTNEYYLFLKSNLAKGQVISLVLPYSLDFIAIILAALSVQYIIDGILEVFLKGII